MKENGVNILFYAFEEIFSVKSEAENICISLAKGQYSSLKKYRLVVTSCF